MNGYHKHLLALSAKIVGAHLAHNEVDTDTVPTIIRNVFNTLAELGASAEAMDPNGYAADGEVEADHAHHHHHQATEGFAHPEYGQTVFADHLVCMECGVGMKMLKRHLLTVHNMTPDEYRAKWALPSDYPMVAADYAKLRSSLALESGLGLKPEDRPSKSRKGRSRD